MNYPGRFETPKIEVGQPFIDAMIADLLNPEARKAREEKRIREQKKLWNRIRNQVWVIRFRLGRWIYPDDID
jgi:hypothetical protein